jgi:hypothetical protein
MNHEGNQPADEEDVNHEAGRVKKDESREPDHK